MTKLVIDGIETDVPPVYTLLQACEAAGAEIPRFCFHERLSIAGNCRMCLVELKGSPKPVASCAWGVRDCRPGPKGEPPEVLTKTPMVRKAREGVMEFLLINHPLDCPICDQGGECDLQDQAMAYGVDSSRFKENKRAVEDKYVGVLVKTIMNRCIHCTRCVRFMTEVAGVPELGAIGRGEDMEITTYLEQAMTSELQGNVVDLCPVGALTSKPYAFAARPWELNKTESIDVMDAVGSAIRIATRGRAVILDCRQDGAALDPTWGRAGYLFNATIAGIGKADALLIVASNPRREAAVLNARIRKRWRMGAFPIGLIGERADLTYPYDYLGAGPQTLSDVALGVHEFGAVLKKAEHPLVIVGMGALARPDGAAIASLAARAAPGAGKDGWNGYSVLHTAAARVGALDVGFVPGAGGRNATEMAAPGALDLLFLLGADEIDIAPGAFVTHIGTHGDAGAHRADVILPGAAYPEKSGIYVNTEGRVQMAGRASFPPGEAREDWAILRALSDVLGRKLPYDSLAQLRQALFKTHPQLQCIDQIASAERTHIAALAARGGALEKTAFGRALDDFYLTNPIARASVVMAQCSVIAEGHAALTAAEYRT